MLKQDAGLTCRRSHNRAAKEGKLLRKGKVQEKKVESMFPPWYLIVDSLLLVVRLMHVWYSNSNSCTISFSNSVQRSCIRKKILTKMNSWDWFPLFEGGKRCLQNMTDTTNMKR